MKKIIFLLFSLAAFSVSAQTDSTVVKLVIGGQVFKFPIAPSGPGSADNSLSEQNQTIADAVARVINTVNSGYVSFAQDGVEQIRIGGNNNNGIRVDAIESLPGGDATVLFVSPPALPELDIDVEDPTFYTNALVYDNDGGANPVGVYFSNGSTWIQVGTVSGGGTSSSYILDDTFTTTSYTPVVTDTFRLKYGKNISNITIEEPTGTYSDGHSISFVQDSTGLLEFNFKDIRKDVNWRTTEEGSVAIMHYTGTGWTFLCGACETYVPTPAFVYLGANAADPNNEVDGTANTDDNGGETTITSSTVAPHDGTYALRIENNGGGSKDASIQLVGVTAGDNVSISFRIKEVVGLSWTTRLLSGDWNVTHTRNVDDGLAGTWEEIFYDDGTHIAQVDNPTLTIRTTSTGNDGDIIDLDNIVVTINSMWWVLLLMFGGAKKLHSQIEKKWRDAA